MINTRSKWRAVARAAARAASSSLPTGDLVIWGWLDWLEGAGVVLCANAGWGGVSEKAVSPKAAASAVLKKNGAAHIELISLFVTQCRQFPSNRMDSLRHGLAGQNPQYPHRTRRVSVQERRRRGHLCGQGEEPAEPGGQLFSRGPMGGCEDGHAGARGGRCGLHHRRE